MEKISIYAKIDKSTRERAMVYITNSKLLNKEIDTLGKLIEQSIEDYMLKHPL